MPCQGVRNEAQRTLLCAVAVAAAFAGPANAIYKCTTAKGVVYQDRPCREGNETDVTIVVPTGEVAPRASATTDEAASANGPRADERAGAREARRTRPTTRLPRRSRRTGNPAMRRRTAPTAHAGRNAPTGAEKTVPLTAEQARKTDPTAKYFATEAFGTGAETPTQMNCESPTGEKRVFYLSNGKLTSI